MPSSQLPINQQPTVAPTPQNTPLTTAPISTALLSRPTVEPIPEDAVGDESGPDYPTAEQQAIMGLVKGKLAGLVGRSSGYIENLPVGVKRKVEALKGVQVDYNALQKEYKKETLELEKKYLRLATPLFTRRTHIISGKAQPTVEEVKAGEEQSKKDDEEYSPLPAAPADLVEEEGAKDGIPEFWLTALRNHIGISELITDRDADALKHLTDITIEYLEPPKPGFKILFHFSENEYFSNSILEKTYLYQDEVGYGGDFIYDRAIGTEIQWKADKDLTKEYEIKKQRNKNTNRTRIVRKAHPTDSFFNFFSPPVPPAEDAIESGDIDEEELEELEERLELDYQIGEDLKERIIPRAIDYFTGKALEYEDMDGEDDDDEFEDDDEEDDDRFEEEDSESDNDVPAKRRGPPKKGGAGANTTEECKQQ